MIVIVGGAGFIGSHLVDFYSSRGHRVRVIDNRSRAELLQAGGSTLSNWDWVGSLPGVDMADVSVLDSDSLADALRDATAVVHAAAQTAVTVSFENPRTDFFVNAVGTFNVLEALRTVAPDAPMVFCSTNKVYGSNVNKLPVHRRGRRYVLEGQWSSGISEDYPIDLCQHSPYGVSKATADLYVQEYGHAYGLRTTVFRLSCVYGPRQWGLADQGWIAWFARAIIEGRPITIYGDGFQTRDVLFISDLVAAVDRALTRAKRGDVLNIGGGPANAVSLIEAIEMLEQLVGTRADLRYADWRPSDQRIYVSNLERARQELGWEPTVDPPDGMKSLVEWLSTDFAGALPPYGEPTHTGTP